MPSATADDPRFAVLDACLERLPERDRRAVELRYFAKARAEQIAQELRVSEGNARRIVFNGVNRLRKCAQAAIGPLTTGFAGVASVTDHPDRQRSARPSRAGPGCWPRSRWPGSRTSSTPARWASTPS